MTPADQRSRNPIIVALYANAAILSLILLLIVGRTVASGGLSWVEVPAFGQQVQPVAGGGSLFIMPAQLSSNTWGCYVLDANVQTLSAYQYFNGEKLLRLVAARSVRYDRQLMNYQTSPLPAEVQAMVERERSIPAAPAPAATNATTEPSQPVAAP